MNITMRALLKKTPCAHDGVDDNEVEPEAVAHVSDRHRVGIDHAGPRFEWQRPWTHVHTDQSSACREAGAAVRQPGGGFSSP